jgi:uncharacterized caspase-like protein
MGKYALLIGVDTYGEGLQPLPAASKDVAALREVLLNPQIGGFDEAKPLINPSQPEMAREIELWFQNRQPEDLVLLFFSGHGVKDDRRDLYFAAANTEKQRDRLLTSTATPARFIHDRIRACKAKYQVLILDCCFSGAFGDLVAKEDGEIPLQEQLGAEGRVVLTSTSAVDYSFEKRGEDLSVYTRYLVEGLATGAADENGAGVITVDELHRYAARKVKETSPAMSPDLITLKGEYRIRVARSPQDDPKLKYRKEAERRATAGEFTIPAKRLLMVVRAELGLSAAEAEEIEAEVLKPHREYQRKRQEYQETLRQSLEHESLLSLSTINDLRDYRAHLRLKPEDVAIIERAALNGRDLEEYGAALDRQRQAQAQQRVETQRQWEETERQKQAKAEAERHQQEKEVAERKQREAAEASRRQKVAATQQPSQLMGTRQLLQTTASPPSPARTTASRKILSRQQFLKWGGLSGLGLIGAFGISQALKNAPSTEVDFTRLAELLAAKQWKDADQETLNVMLKITNREDQGRLDMESLWNFPCEVLVKLDQLWVKASDGKFGFSVQKKIYADDCGGQPNGQYDPNGQYNPNAFDCFGDKVGWRVNGAWLDSDSQVIFDAMAPTGHLPFVWLVGGGWRTVEGLWGSFSSLAETCKL